MSCATNSTKNLRIISGALVLTAIKESFANKSFTSATVISRQSFNLTRSNLIFEARAALPTAEGVFAIVLLIPEEDVSKYCLKEAFFLLVNYHKTIKAGYKRTGQYDTFKRFNTSPKLNRFSEYYTEFHQVNTLPTSTWSIDRNLQSSWKNSINVTCNVQDCEAMIKKTKFRLAISLVIGAFLEGGDMQQVMIKAKNWWCSSMIVDYIRVYELDQFETLNNPLIFKNSVEKRAGEICNHVSLELGRKNFMKDDKDDNSWMVNSFYIISAILFVSFLLLLFLVCRICKIKRKMKRTRVRENIYQSIELPDILSSMTINDVYGNNQGCNEYEYITYGDLALESDQDNLNNEKS